MNLNEVRNVIIDRSTDANLLPMDSAGALALALVYVGDSIREACSDIGPAIAQSGALASAETSDVSQALRDLTGEFAGIVAAVDGIGK